MSLLLLCALSWPMPQRPAEQAPPATAQSPSQSEEGGAREFWSRLSPEERQRLEERRRAFYSLPPEAREEMLRRFRALDEQRGIILQELAPEERERLRSASPDERRRFLDERIRGRMEERARHMEQAFPDEARRLRDLPLPDRVECSRGVRERMMRDHVEERVERAVESGWVGPTGAAWLRQAPPHEAMNALDHFRMWEMQAELDRNGEWEQWGVGEILRHRFAELPPREFMHAIDRLRAGASPEEALAPPAWERGWDRRFRDGAGPREGFGPHEGSGPWERRGPRGREGEPPHPPPHGRLRGDPQ